LAIGSWLKANRSRGDPSGSIFAFKQLATSNWQLANVKTEDLTAKVAEGAKEKQG